MNSVSNQQYPQTTNEIPSPLESYPLVCAFDEAFFEPGTFELNKHLDPSRVTHIMTAIIKSGDFAAAIVQINKLQLFRFFPVINVIFHNAIQELREEVNRIESEIIQTLPSSEALSETQRTIVEKVRLIIEDKLHLLKEEDEKLSAGDLSSISVSNKRKREIEKETQVNPLPKRQKIGDNNSFFQTMQAYKRALLQAQEVEEIYQKLLTNPSIDEKVKEAMEARRCMKYQRIMFYAHFLVKITFEELMNKIHSESSSAEEIVKAKLFFLSNAQNYVNAHSKCELLLNQNYKHLPAIFSMITTFYKNMPASSVGLVDVSKFSDDFLLIVVKNLTNVVFERIEYFKNLIKKVNNKNDFNKFIKETNNSISMLINEISSFTTNYQGKHRPVIEKLKGNIESEIEYLKLLTKTVRARTKANETEAVYVKLSQTKPFNLEAVSKIKADLLHQYGEFIKCHYSLIKLRLDRITIRMKSRAFSEQEIHISKLSFLGSLQEYIDASLRYELISNKGSEFLRKKMLELNDFITKLYLQVPLPLASFKKEIQLFPISDKLLKVLLYSLTNLFMNEISSYKNIIKEWKKVNPTEIRSEFLYIKLEEKKALILPLINELEFFIEKAKMRNFHANKSNKALFELVQSEIKYFILSLSSLSN